MKNIYVLFWRYDDGSGCEVVRAYINEDRARQDLALLEKETTGKEWSVLEIPIMDGYCVLNEGN